MPRDVHIYPGLIRVLYGLVVLNSVHNRHLIMRHCFIAVLQSLVVLGDVLREDVHAALPPYLPFISPHSPHYAKRNYDRLNNQHPEHAALRDISSVGQFNVDLIHVVD